MDTTVLTPGSGQSVVATSDGPPRRDVHDDFLATEQAAWGRASNEQHGDIRAEIGDAKCDVVAAVNQVQLDAVKSLAQSEAATGERIAQASRDTGALVVHGFDAARESAAKLQQQISDVRFEQGAQHGVTLGRIAEFEHQASLAYMERFGEIELRIAKEGSDVRLKMLEQSCDLKALVISQAAETRKEIADARTRDLERENLLLQMKLAAKKPIKP